MTLSDNQSPGNITVWRKGWDSNPRTGSSPITRFRVERVTASSLPFHKRVLYTKTGPRASLFSGPLPQNGRPRAAAGYRRSRTPCASRAFSPAGSPAASGRGQKPLPPCSFAAPRRKKRPAFTKRILFQCLANRRGVQTKRCRRSAQSGSLRRSSMSACSCAMSASSPSKRRS